MHCFKLTLSSNPVHRCRDVQWDAKLTRKTMFTPDPYRRTQIYRKGFSTDCHDIQDY